MWRLVLALTLCSGTALGADVDFLVNKGEDGKFGPGAAASWKADGTTVTFVLADGVDAEGTATTLRDSLATATVEVVGGTIVVSGVPAEALLDQLSALSLSGEGGDPLAALAGLGGAAAMDAPEGGGSIRASKPTATVRPRIIKSHDPKERVVAEVVKVDRGDFPVVTLTLKIKSSAKVGPLKKKLRRGKVVSGKVALHADQGGINYAIESTQRNVGAYYLAKGDRISVHAVENEGVLDFDFVERQKK